MDEVITNRAFEKNSSFSTTHPKLQLAWDSHSLGTFKECPRKYEYEIVEGFQGKPNNPHLLFGIWLHAALEYYDKALAKGQDHEDALRNTVRQTLHMAQETMFEHQCRGCAMTLIFAVKHTHCPNCGTAEPKIIEFQRPWKSDDKNKTRYNLLRTVVWYLLEFQDHPMETIQLATGPAVELSFSFDTGITAPDGTNYVFCGHIDRIAEMSNERWIMDRKTTKSTISSKFFDGFTPDNQMSMYTLAGQVAFGQEVKGVIVDGAQVAIGFSRFQRGYALRNKETLEEWVKDSMIWINQAADCAANDHWPMNDKSCHNYGGCPYRGICSKSPLVRDEFLAANYTRRKWDPLERR